jgi:lysozyme family protein
MQEDFEKSIAFVLKMEGGYTLDPNDPGGETNFGISRKAYPSLDIKNLTVEKAKEIYIADYWRPCHCDELPFPFAISVFDTAVNQGVGKAKRILQIVLGVTVDGIIGSQTIAAAFRADHRVIKLFLAHRMAEYARIMAANQNLLVFATNWFYRVLALAEIVFDGEVSNAGK